ncbi:MAG: hypothetical protein KGM47_02020, partial [Acidobacteriota bacterium]|nr:hypothetical protein [Acidobacteriota bacterium]
MMTGERFRTFCPVAAVIVILTTVTALALPGAGPNPLRGLSTPPSPSALIPQARIYFKLSPGEQVAYTLPLKSGEYAEVSIEQLEGLLQAVLISPDGKQGVPHLIDAGRGSVIRLPIVAEQDGVYLVRVAVRVPEPEGAGSIIATIPHAATASDLNYAAGWNQFAEAEWIRKNGSPKAQAKGLRDYGAAFNAAESLKDWTLARAALTGKARIMLFNLTDYPAGTNAVQKATRIPGAGEDTSGEALAWKTLSSAESYSGDYAASIDAANKALTLYRVTGDRYWQGIVLGNIAYAY